MYGNHLKYIYIYMLSEINCWKKTLIAIHTREASYQRLRSL